MTSRRISRRRALQQLAATALAAPALSRANAQGLRPISMSLSWLADGYSAYAYAAKGRGFWRERGLDVTISRGTGSVPTAQAIATGKFDFGLSNATVVMQMASKGASLRALAMISYETSMGVAMSDTAPIREPRDLEGKKVAQTLASSDAAFFVPFCKLNGVDPAKIEIVSMDAQLRDRALIQGTVDAETGFASSFVASLVSSGLKVRSLLYSKFGLPLYGDATLLTTGATATADPKLCAAMADGLMEGLKFSLLRPEETRDLLLEAAPEHKLSPNGPELLRLGMAVQRFNVLASQDPRQHGLGWADPDKLAATADLVLKFQGAPGAVRPDMPSVYRNEFAGRVRLTDEEWATAAAVTRFINPYLGEPA